MQVKRYVAESMRHALKQVREELGPEAVILSSKRMANGVEILVALEQPANEEITRAAAPDAGRPGQSVNPFQVDEIPAGHKKTSRLESELDDWHRANQQRAKMLADAIARQQVKEEVHANPAIETGPGQSVDNSDRQPEQQPVSDNPATVARYQDNQGSDLEPDVVTLQSAVKPSVMSPPEAAAANTQSSPGPALQRETDSVKSEVSDLRKELQSMRDMLEQQLSSVAWGSYRQQRPQQAGLWRRLKRMGLSAAISQGLLDSLPKKTDACDKDLWQVLMSRFAQTLPVGEHDITAKGGIFALVGATGAGKTTTIGKLATRYVLEHGAEQVALVTTDTARIAAFEQLRTFGRILNVPVKVVDRNTTLEQVLYSLRHKSLVLIDTAGLNQQDARLQQQLNTLNELSGRVKNLLVLPATSQAAVIKSVYHAYKGINLSGCILTKLDEAASMGEVLSLTTDKQLPIIYTTNGQAIPNDLHVADSYGLIRSAIELAKPVAVSDDAMADEVSHLGGS